MAVGKVAGTGFRHPFEVVELGALEHFVCGLTDFLCRTVGELQPLASAARDAYAAGGEAALTGVDTLLPVAREKDAGLFRIVAFGKGEPGEELQGFAAKILGLVHNHLLVARDAFFLVQNMKRHEAGILDRHAPRVPKLRSHFLENGPDRLSLFPRQSRAAPFP